MFQKGWSSLALQDLNSGKLGSNKAFKATWSCLCGRVGTSCITWQASYKLHDYTQLTEAQAYIRWCSCICLDIVDHNNLDFCHRFFLVVARYQNRGYLASGMVLASILGLVGFNIPALHMWNDKVNYLAQLGWNDGTKQAGLLALVLWTRWLYKVAARKFTL